MDVLSLIKIAFVLAVVLYVHTLWAKRRIGDWALRNNYTINTCKLCLFNIGPFSYFGTSGGQSIFRIEALDTKGHMRTGYARAGGFFFGLWRDRVEVKWDRALWE